MSARCKNDPRDGGEAQGGIERQAAGRPVDQVTHGTLIHRGAVVAHLERRPDPGGERANAILSRLPIDRPLVRGNAHEAAERQGFARVDHQSERHLLNLATLDGGPDTCTVEGSLQRDERTE